MKNSLLFTPAKIGPLTLRNRTIRSAAFESMCENNSPTQMLEDYHVSVARGGIGMTTLAYASVTRNGLSFKRQLWMREEIVPGLRRITDAIHREGAAASIQIGHCGNMSKKSVAGQLPISASSGLNIYSPTFVRGMRPGEIEEVAKAFGHAVRLAVRRDSMPWRCMRGMAICSVSSCRPIPTTARTCTAARWRIACVS